MRSINTTIFTLVINICTSVPHSVGYLVHHKEKLFLKLAFWASESQASTSLPHPPHHLGWWRTGSFQDSVLSSILPRKALVQECLKLLSVAPILPPVLFLDLRVRNVKVLEVDNSGVMALAVPQFYPFPEWTFCQGARLMASFWELGFSLAYGCGGLGRSSSSLHSRL